MIMKQENMRRDEEMAKVLLLNGSPRANGCTGRALEEMIRVFAGEGIETELIHIGNKNIRGCIACNTCRKRGKCVFDDLVNEIAPKFEAADGLVIGSPVYYASPNGTSCQRQKRRQYSLLRCAEQVFHKLRDGRCYQQLLEYGAWFYC